MSERYVVKEEKLRLKPEYIFEIKFQKHIDGISLTAGRKGDEIQIAKRGLFSTYDGERFYNCINHLTQIFLSDWMLIENKNESHIRNCLIYFYKNKKARVHINFPTIMEILSKRNINKFSPVMKSDIADIKSVRFPGIRMRSNCDIIYIYSIGWRKGLYFDFIPHSSKEYKMGDSKTIFASLHSYLLFPEIHRIEPEVKKMLFENGWFPFIRILGNHFKALSDAANNKFPLEEEAMKIIESFGKEKILEMKATWMKKDIFKNHEKVITKGINEYIEGDYISSISVLYPRIEGLMRYIYLEEKEDPTSKKLRTKLTRKAKEKTIERGLFLPDDFNEYLKTFYFSKFDLKKDDTDVSRHSVAHGVAKEEDFSQIKAFQAILILDQIHFYV